MGGAQFGVHLGLPIPENLTIALWFLILGTGYAALLIGIRIGCADPDGSAERAAVAAD